MTHLLRRQRARSRLFVRLRLEVLESRTLPSTLTVLNDFDSGPDSLRAALAEAVDGDLINFSTALAGTTITLTTGQLTVASNVTIQGLGANQLRVSGNRASRAFAVTANVSATISDLTVANGTTTDAGGGIINEGTLILDHCTVSGNTAVVSDSTDFHSGLGGGIFNDYQGTLSLNACTISGNKAVQGYSGGYGGGIYSLGSLTLNNSQVSDNLADGGGGGGIFSTFELTSTAPLTLTGCTISDNRATYVGGGIVCGSRALITITDCAVTGNSARSEGGGILAGGENGTLIVDHCTISGNTASWAGVVYEGDLAGPGQATFTDCTITDNTGDGLDALIGNLTVTDCDISRNTGFGVHAGSVSDMTFTGCTVSDNGGVRRLDGGGMAVSSYFGTTTISGCTISGNRGTTVGSIGGLSIDGEAIVSDCLILNNSATWGGGVLVGAFSDTEATLDHCQISGNTALMRDGGGILNGGFYADSTLTITGCTVSDNVAVQGDGGGIANQIPYFGQHTETISIVGSTLSGNSAGGTGGAFYNQGNATLFNSTFYDNRAISSGGAIFADQGSTLSVTSATIDANVASSGGGIFASASAAVLINNSIVARNGETALARGRDVYGTVQSQGYNLIGASNDSSGWIASDILGTASDPVDPRLGALQDNGGATFTQALLPDSPAIAAGDPALLGTYDQRGVLRQGAVDIGAFETAP